MAYLIFALVPVVMLLLLVMPRLEEWCTAERSPVLLDTAVPVAAAAAPAPAPVSASGLEAGALVGELPA